MENKIPFSSIGHMFHSLLHSCFRQIHNVQEEKKFFNELKNAYPQKNLSLFCSEFVLLVWQLSLLLQNQVVTCMPLVPQFCHPFNVLELPHRFPSCWSSFTLPNCDAIKRVHVK